MRTLVFVLIGLLALFTFINAYTDTKTSDMLILDVPAITQTK